MNGPKAGQDWDAEGYARNAGFVAELGAAILDRLAPQPGEHILDLGCGDGVLTKRIAKVDADVIGLEPDPSMAAASRSLGLTVMEQDAHEPFGNGTFDAVFSNAALHWMRKPEVVLGNARKALRPGGRLVAEQGGFGNVAAVRTAIAAALEAAGYAASVDPWDFPSPAGQSARLERAGFEVERIALMPRPTPLPTGMAGWLATFADPYLREVPGERRSGVIEDTQRRLTHLQDEQGVWFADYVRLRFEAAAR